jgi:hypothetical protein
MAMLQLAVEWRWIVALIGLMQFAAAFEDVRMEGQGHKINIFHAAAHVALGLLLLSTAWHLDEAATWLEAVAAP